MVANPKIYAQRVTLLHKYSKLDSFEDKAVSAELLGQLRKDLADWVFRSNVTMPVQTGAEAADKSDCANVQGRLVRVYCTGAVSRWDLWGSLSLAQLRQGNRLLFQPFALCILEA